jgi:filamentous hemagglutinin family protein
MIPKVASVALAVAACFASAPALANPTGPTVVNGTATIVPSGSTLNITNSPNAIINWQGFSIGAGEVTRFIQQSAVSAVLNRVTTPGNPSTILGSLQSNGRVFLVNPSGILFGAGAQVDVAGLVASTLNLSNEDFLAGRLRFTETPRAGAVTNVGNIATPEGGQVYLVGSSVINGGVITSPRGEVLLAAGKSVELVNPGTPDLRVEIVAPRNEVVNLGEIVANAGRIGIFAGLIRNRNLLQADAAQVEENGEILLRATRHVSVDSTGRIDARTRESGSSGLPQTFVDIMAGGDIRLDGPIDARRGQATLTSGGNILFNGPPPGSFWTVQAHMVNLRATAPGKTITAGPTGTVLASRILDIVANGDVILPNRNAVNWLTANMGAGGDLRMSISGFILPELRRIRLAGGDLELKYNSFGGPRIRDDVQARRISITEEFGSIDVNALIAASGQIDISARESVVLQSFGRSVGISGGQGVKISAGRDLLLSGGQNPNAHALITGRSVDLTVGGVLGLQEGTAPGAWARIETTHRNSPIQVFFPNLSSGGYFVNGVEGQVTDGLSGFFTGGHPAVPGQTLLLEYGQP